MRKTVFRGATEESMHMDDPLAYQGCGLREIWRQR
jgi:hypothetical protein